MPQLLGQLDLEQCPHCGVNAPNLFLIHSFETTSFKPGPNRYWKIYACKGCGGVVSAASTQSSNGEASEIYPTSTEIDLSIPNPARSYLAQANSSLHAPAGAIMLAASSVDAMLKAHGYKDGS